MGVTKNDTIQIRVSDLEKSVIKDKAELLGLTITDYIKECCIFSNTTEMLMKKLHYDYLHTDGKKL